MKKKQQKHLWAVLCVMLLAVQWLAVGCSADPTPIPSGTNGETVYMPKPMEDIAPETVETMPQINLVQYEGNAIIDGYTGTNLAGFSYCLPAANLEELGSFGDSLDWWIEEVALTNNGIWKGNSLIPLSFVNGFSNHGGIWVSDYIYGLKQVFYDVYTNSYLNGLEFASVFMGQDISSLKEDLREQITEQYKEAANSNIMYTPAGLELTCADEHLKTLDVRLEYGEIYATIQFLDGNGNADGESHFMLKWRGERSWPKDVRNVWICNDTLSYSWTNGSHDLFISPGIDEIDNLMFADIAAYLDKGNSSIPQVSCDARGTGRYVAFELTINDQQPLYYYYDLMNGKVVSVEDVCDSACIDKEVSNTILLPKIDEHYQQRCSEITGQPFHWEHDESMYQKTLSVDNLQNIQFFPYNGSFSVYYPAWLPGSDEASIEQLDVPLFEQIWLGSNGYINAEDVMLYPGLMELLVSKNGNIVSNGYMDYVVWQHEDVLVVAIGWFGPNNDSFDYDLCSIDLNTGMWFDCNETLEYLGQDFGSFRSYVLDALKLKLESRGCNLSIDSIQENDESKETIPENLAEEDDGITLDDAKELASQFWGFESVEDLQKDGDLFVDVIDELEEEGVLYYAVALQTPRHGRLSTMDIVYVNTVTGEADYFF